MYIHRMVVRELAEGNAKDIRQLANAFVEGHITQEEFEDDVEFRALIFLKEVFKVKNNGNRKGA